MLTEMARQRNLAIPDQISPIRLCRPRVLSGINWWNERVAKRSAARRALAGRV